MDTTYSSDIADAENASLEGFFVGWKSAPDRETFLRILRGSGHIVLAIEDGEVVGFCTALTDGALAAFIPLLEVLPSHHGRGIGRKLVETLLERLGAIYAIDLVCDEDKVGFYKGMGFVPMRAMSRRNYEAQAGTAP